MDIDIMDLKEVGGGLLNITDKVFKAFQKTPNTEEKINSIRHIYMD